MSMYSTIYQCRRLLGMPLLLGGAVVLLVACATQFAQDAGDPCATERAELRGAQNYYTQAVVEGAVVGGVVGALTGYLTGKSPKAAAAGAGIGAVAGGIGGYYLAKQKVASDAAALSNSILKDVQTENAEIDRATVAFAKLRNCRFTAAQQVKAEFAAGRISRAQAISRLDELRARFNQDLAIADEVGTKMADKSREFVYASDQLVAANPEAKSYLASYPMTSEEPVTPPSTPRPAPKPTPKPTPKPSTVTRTPSLPPKAPPPPKAAPVVTVAQETNTNQLKQKKYNNEVAVAKSESSKAFSLEGQVSLLLPACPVCGNG